MIHVYHVIGFKSIELGRLGYRPETLPAIQAASRQRFEQIVSEGVLLARRHLPQAWDSPGRSFSEDNLAGDDRYIFLGADDRYLRQASAACYGFVFDAEMLIRRYGALVGTCDLAEDYTEIIGGAAEQVAATLPSLPRISDQELDEFMALMGETDPAMRQHISDRSTDPEHGLLDAVRDGDTNHPGYEAAITIICRMMADLHDKTRLSGQAALDYLRDGTNAGFEVLVPDRLPVSAAVGVIREGEVSLFGTRVSTGKS